MLGQAECCTPPSPGAGRILVVDDDPLVLRAYSRLLGASGYAVENVGNPTEVVARAGSGNFDVVISDVHMPQMSGLAVLRALRQSDPDLPVLLITGNPQVETAAEAVRFGAVRYLFKPVSSVDLIEAVDAAIAKRRQAVRDRITLRAALHDVDGNPTALGALGQRLDAAMAGLWVAFQPIVSWRARTIRAYEALVRTDEPSLPQPGALFEAAERTGRLRELGRAIRDRIAAEAVAAPADVDLFVNLHPDDLLDGNLYEPTARLSALAPRVVLEITERASLNGIADLDDRLDVLRGLGFRLAVDDLGEGYAGLATLAAVKPQVAKIDMSLVRGIHREPTKAKLVAALVHLCSELGVVLVAEGVENTDERDALARLGADLLQGYLFARPARGFAALDLGRDEPGP